MMMFFSSFGSFGVSRMNNSSSSSARRASVSVISAFASSAISSPPVANFRASSKFFVSCWRSSAFAIKVSSSEKRLFLMVNSGSLYAVGCAKKSAKTCLSAIRSSKCNAICAI